MSTSLMTLCIMTPVRVMDPACHSVQARSMAFCTQRCQKRMESLREPTHSAIELSRQSGVKVDDADTSSL